MEAALGLGVKRRNMRRAGKVHFKGGWMMYRRVEKLRKTVRSNEHVVCIRWEGTEPPRADHDIPRSTTD
jgi:hypothetical protein